MNRRLGVIAVLLAMLTSACAGGESGQPGPEPTSPTTTAPASPSPTPTESPSPTRKVTFELWFTKGGKLFLTKRTEAFRPAVAELALLRLLRGPNFAERRAGAETAILDDTVLRGINLRDGIATVDLSSGFGATGNAATLKLRAAQVVYTVTQFPSIKGVRLELDGTPAGSFAGKSRSATRPVTRRTYASVLPAIVVESPTIGAPVSSPVVVRGTANVFEATVSLRIRDAQGRELVRTFTTATCGTGCRGDYSKSVRFSVPSKQAGTIEVFEESAENGQPINVVTIPVTLLP